LFKNVIKSSIGEKKKTPNSQTQIIQNINMQNEEDIAITHQSASYKRAGR